MKFLKSISTCLPLLALMVGGALAQPVNAQAQKLAEFGNIRADDEMAYLDLLAKALTESPNAHGYVIRYNRRDFPLGLFLRGLYGYRDYLVKSRGIELGRVVVVAGGNKNKITTELWLVPEGTPTPKPDSELAVAPTASLRFDTVYPDCASEFSIHLEELDDYLRFYAEALRGNPNARSRIIVYPGKRSRLSKAKKMAQDTRSLLITKYNVGAERIVAKARGGRRECSEIELWIVSAGAVPARATHNNGMHPTANSAAFIRETPCLFG